MLKYCPIEEENEFVCQKHYKHYPSSTSTDKQSKNCIETDFHSQERRNDQVEKIVLIEDDTESQKKTKKEELKQQNELKEGTPEEKQIRLEETTIIDAVVKQQQSQLAKKRAFLSQQIMLQKGKKRKEKKEEIEKILKKGHKCKYTSTAIKISETKKEKPTKQKKGILQLISKESGFTYNNKRVHFASSSKYTYHTYNHVCLNDYPIDPNREAQEQIDSGYQRNNKTQTIDNELKRYNEHSRQKHNTEEQISQSSKTLLNCVFEHSFQEMLSFLRVMTTPYRSSTKEALEKIKDELHKLNSQENNNTVLSPNECPDSFKTQRQTKESLKLKQKVIKIFKHIEMTIGKARRFHTRYGKDKNSEKAKRIEISKDLKVACQWIEQLQKEIGKHDQIKCSIDANITCFDNLSMLHAAVFLYDTMAIKILFQLGVDASIQSQDFGTAFDVAKKLSKLAKERKDQELEIGFQEIMKQIKRHVQNTFTTSAGVGVQT